MAGRRLDLQDLSTIITHKIKSEIHTMMPGKIVTYYPSTQTADVQPMCQRVYWSKDDVGDVPAGNAVHQRYPVIGNVPVEFPGGGGFGVWFPLSEGDTCDIEFSESSWADYLATGQESPQQDVGRHKLGFALVHPVVCPTTPVTDSAITGNDRMVVGHAGGSDQVQFDGTHVIVGKGATDFAALASVVDANFKAITDYLTVIFGPSGGPSTIICASPSSPAVIAGTAHPPTINAVAASVAKVK